MTDIMTMTTVNHNFEPLENSTIPPFLEVETLQNSLHLLLSYLDSEEEDDLIHYNMVRKLYPYAVIGNITHMEFIKVSQKLTNFINDLSVNEDIYEPWCDVQDSFNHLPFCDDNGNIISNNNDDDELLEDEEDESEAEEVPSA